MRPTVHLAAPRDWMNDPVGLVHWRGRYHVFYQHNPAAPRWGLIHWGHASSADLVAWTDHGIALAPSPAGPDRDGCWSGSVVVVDGTPTAYYTGASGEGSDHRESVCRAMSDGDLTLWRKDAANPVIAGEAGPGTRHRRDPFVMRHGDGWLMLLGSGILGQDGVDRGAVIAYESADAVTWRDRGVLFAQPSDGVPWSGPVWECPQLVRVHDRWILIVSVQGRGGPEPICLGAIWFVGDLEDSTFRATATGRLDGGDVLYAPAVLMAPDGRTLMWAWLQDPAPDLQGPDVTVGALSIPRVIEVSGERVASRPVAEVDALAVGHPIQVAEIRLGPGESRAVTSGIEHGEAYRVTFDVTADALAGAEVLGSPDGRHTLAIGLDRRGGRPRLVVAEVEHGRASVTHAEDLPSSTSQTTVDVFVDGTIVEAFADGVSITTRVDRRLMAEPIVTLVAIDGSARLARAGVVRLAPPGDTIVSGTRASVPEEDERLGWPR